MSTPAFTAIHHDAANPTFADGPIRPACSSYNPEWWFPVSVSGYDLPRAICNSCPLLRPCREWALETGQEWGMWAALTPDERKVLLRRRTTITDEPTP